MHCDHHIFGLLATHWHELTKKHKHSEAFPKSTELGLSKDAKSTEGIDLILWTKCFEVCEKNHGESLPCFSMADFNAFLTSHTQNFVAKDCNALQVYNDLFGKQNLKEILLKTKGKGSSLKKKTTGLNLDLLTMISSDVGGFLDESFILRASHSVAQFLEIDFQNPLNPLFCMTFRKREAYNAIRYYINDVDYSCLSIPAFLHKMKATLEIVEELKAQIYTEGSSLVIGDLKVEATEAVNNSQSIMRGVFQVRSTIESGEDLLRTLSAWANYECTLEEVYLILRRRHEMLMGTIPFDRIQKLQGLCDYLSTSSKAIAGTVSELEENLPDSLSLSLSFDPNSIPQSGQSTKEKMSNLSTDSFLENVLVGSEELLGCGDSF